MYATDMPDGRIAICRGRRVLKIVMTMAAAIAFMGAANAQDVPKAKKPPSTFTQCRDSWADKKPTAEKFGYFHHMSDCLKGKTS